MLAAMAEAMSEQGYVRTSVADVITRAGVSRETFYQQFRSKQDCFLAAFDASAAVLFTPGIDQGALDVDANQAVGAATDPTTPLARFDALLDRYLRGLAAHPDHARLFLVEVYAAGPEAIERRMELQATVAEAIGRLFDVHDDVGRFACQALVAAISALVTPPLVARDLDALVALRAPIVSLVERYVALGAGVAATPPRPARPAR